VDELKAARLSATKALGDGLSSVEIGVNYSERSKALVNDEWFLRVKGSPASVAIPRRPSSARPRWPSSASPA
jgi:iron complex outermembrane receptor protein